MDLYRRVCTYMQEQQLIEQGDDLIVGVSGGADSVCLLLLLHRFCGEHDCTLTAVHVNHLLRGADADRDEAFVKDLCAKLSVPFIGHKVDVRELAKKQKESIEEAGRKARYRLFCEAAKDKCAGLCDKEAHIKIATAHQQGDQAETVLLNLVRGSASAGLTGIKPKSSIGAFTLIRPLLTQSRADIEDYLKEQNAAYCTDATNEDTGYARNAMRRLVLPEMENINPQATAHIAASASYLSEIEAYLRQETAKKFEETVVREEDCVRISISRLCACEPLLTKRVLCEAAALACQSRKDITSTHIQALYDLTKRQSGKRLSLSHQTCALRQYDELLLYKENIEKDASKPVLAFEKEEIKEAPQKTFAALFDGRTVELSFVPVCEENRACLQQKNLYTKAFDYDTIKGTITVGEKVFGDKIHLQSGTKSLKKFFIDEKIPAQERDKVMLLRDSESVMWVIGLRISERHKITEHTTRAIIVRVTDGGRHEHEH